MIRAGISHSLTDTPPSISGETLPRSESTHRVKHAAIGAGVGTGLGLVVGALIGMQIDKTGSATFPATPIVAIESAGIGLVAGLVVGALIP